MCGIKRLEKTEARKTIKNSTEPRCPLGKNDPAIRYPISITNSIKGVYHPHTGQKAITADINEIKPIVEATGINLGELTSISSNSGTTNAA